MSLPENTIKISDMVTSNDLTPNDFIPIVRYDTNDDDYDNYKVAAKEFISYPNGYLQGGIVTVSGSSITVGETYCRDTTNEANIFLTSSVTKSISSSFYPVSQSSGTKYFIVCRVSDTDQTASFFVCDTKSTVPTGYTYSRAVGQCEYNSNTGVLSNVWCYDHEIDVIQTTDITAGSPLTNGHLALVID